MALDLDSLSIADGKLVQAGLKHFGFYDGTLFGKPGVKTKDAYQRYLDSEAVAPAPTPAPPTSAEPLELSSAARQELDFSGDIQTGAKGRRARRVQEWVSIHGFRAAIDDDFGEATARAVRELQRARGLTPSGIVDAATWGALVAPLARALGRIAPGASFGETVLNLAKQHLREHPIEVGGANCGPWVRTYMDGHQGSAWPWCAGFVTFVMKQAAKIHGVNPPLAGSFSCDLLATQAKQANRFVAGGSITNLATSDLGTCCLFLVRRTSSDWTHTGFAFDLATTTFATIEGNTNDAGDREGYEVCKRLRGSRSMDFIRLD